VNTPGRGHIVEPLNNLLDKLANWRPFTALVVGDFMLDQLVYGDAERLSPDAPVPVLLARRTEDRPGGSANVCLNLAALGATVESFGVTGDDDESNRLRAALGHGGVRTEGLIRDPSRPTTVKRSLIGLAQHRHPQKMFRIDMESREPLADEILAGLLERFDASIAGADVVCIEDYNKGVCCPRLCAAIIARCKDAGVEVLVDPAAISDYARYRGATAITPNRTEAELALGRATDDADPESATTMALELLAALDLDTVVLTLDKDGSLVVERPAPGMAGVPIRVPTLAREVYDVTGAGDMVLAALAAARANGFGWHDAAKLANLGAGLVVEMFGIEPIPLATLRHAALRASTRLIGKLRSVDEANVELEAHRRDGKRIVFTNGCFDILHAGHVALVRKARSHGDVLVIGLNTDASVRRLKGPTRPVNDQGDRATLLSELESVGLVVLFDEDTPIDLIKALRPDVLVKGEDYQKHEVVGAQAVESWGGTVELVPLLAGRSTTSAIERARAR
jgi:D-beta-D-heptose 7-phosphate kinase/D-beta-D-heptose 1-phosphate adenosyltransferase